MSKNDALEIFIQTIDRLKPDQLIHKSISVSNNILSVNNDLFDLSVYKNIFILGTGKASAGMARAVEDKLADRIISGLVVVNYGNTVPCQKVEIIEAAHPIPDENCIIAGKRMLELASLAGQNDLVIVLISGGGSALLEVLPQGISLEELQDLNQQLIACGADISEINTIRKHISLLKGGQLAKKIYPATCLTLLISDVPGDNLQNIASGPTVADETTYRDAVQIIRKYKLSAKISPAIMSRLKKGVDGNIAETLKSADPAIKNVRNMIIGNNGFALQTAQEIAQKMGFHVLLNQNTMQGEARKMAAVITEKMFEKPDSGSKECLLYGGETTVTLKGKGKGGRNQELALAALLKLKNYTRPFTLLSCGTDGADGPTDAAGAVIKNDSLERCFQAGLDPAEYLFNNDSYHFFEKMGDLVKTGLTGTNVMDLVIVLLE